MTSAPETPPLRKSEIIVESDWLTTVWAVLGLVVFFLLLLSSVRHLVWGQFVSPRPVRWDLFGILNEVCRAAASILAFVMAFEFREKPLKVGCFLGGLSLAASSLLSFLHLSPRASHTAAVAGSVVWQVVLVLFLVATAQWLKSVVIRAPPTEPPGGES